MNNKNREKNAYCAMPVIIMMLLAALTLPHCIPKTPPRADQALAVPEAMRTAIEAQAYSRVLPTRLQAFTSLVVKTPHRGSSFWEGGLWISQPETVTFEAVNEFGNTIFYFRYTKAYGWVLEEGTGQETIPLPVSGKQFLTFLMGRPPPLPTDAKRLPADPKLDPSLIRLVSGRDVWIFNRDGTPSEYYHFDSSARNAYKLIWKNWKAAAGYSYASTVTLEDLKGRLQLRLTLHEVEIHR